MRQNGPRAITFMMMVKRQHTTDVILTHIAPELLPCDDVHEGTIDLAVTERTDNLHRLVSAAEKESKLSASQTSPPICADLYEPQGNKESFSCHKFQHESAKSKV